MNLPNPNSSSNQPPSSTPKILFFFKVSMILFLLASIPLHVSHSATCSSTASNLNTIESQKNTFIINGIYGVYVYLLRVVQGPVSNSLYHCYFSNNNGMNSVVRRVNADGSEAWMFAKTGGVFYQSLAVDSKEQYLYYATECSSNCIIKLSANNGELADAKSFNNFSFYGEFKINLLYDDSGYYIFMHDSSNICHICKYIFSSPSAVECLKMSEVNNNFTGGLMISDSEFFFYCNPNPRNLLYFVKINLNNSLKSWVNKMICPSSTCNLLNSESLISSDKSKLYSLFSYGTSPCYFYLVCFSPSDGSTISSLYKSSINVAEVGSATLNMDYVISTVQSFPSYLVVYNTVTSAFTIRKSNDYILNLITVESVSDRVIVSGRTNSLNNAYISKFSLGSLDAHSDFSTTVLTMNEIPKDVEDIRLHNKQITLVPFMTNAYVPTFNLISAAFKLVSNNISDVHFQTRDQSISILENSYIQIIPDLTCPSSGSTAISYGVAGYNGESAPSWVSIDSATGMLTLATPSVPSDTDYDFVISSSIAGISNLILKHIKLTVQICTAANCNKCSETDRLICKECNSGYHANSGICEKDEENPKELTEEKPKAKSEEKLEKRHEEKLEVKSEENSEEKSEEKTEEKPLETSIETPDEKQKEKTFGKSDDKDEEKFKDKPTTGKMVITIIQVCVYLSLVLALILCYINYVKISILLSLVNQLQMFFLLLLTRSSIPKTIVEIITTSKLALNFPGYLLFQDTDFFKSVFSGLYYEQRDETFRWLGVQSEITIYNILPMLILLLIISMIIIPFLISYWLFIKLNLEGVFPKISGMFKCIKITCTKRIICSIYIRLVITMSLYIIISATYELNNLNTRKIWRALSLMLVTFLTVCFIIILTLVLLSLYHFHCISNRWHSTFEELFRGIKADRMSRLFSFFQLIRKVIFVILLVMCTFIGTETMKSILIVCQILYLILLCKLLPFVDKVGNLIEIINESVFLILLIVIFFIKSKDDWNTSLTDIYSLIILGNIITIIFFISSKGYQITFIGDLFSILKSKVIEWNQRSNINDEKPKIYDETMMELEFIDELDNTIDESRMENIREKITKSKKNKTEEEFKRRTYFEHKYEQIGQDYKENNNE